MHDGAQASIVEMIRLDKQASLTRGKQAPLRFGETRTSLVSSPSTDNSEKCYSKQSNSLAVYMPVFETCLLPHPY